jgi:TRAP-type uncharacterized transport system substrate-binding protein
LTTAAALVPLGGAQPRDKLRVTAATRHKGSSTMVQPASRTSIAAAIYGAAAILCGALITPADAQIVDGYDLATLTPELKEKVRVNAGAVSMLVSGSACTCARFAEDIRNVLNDVSNPHTGGVRIVPILGQGGLQNLKDTLFLSGINMAMVDESTLKVLKQSNPRAYGDVEKRLRYITNLYNAELHILAKTDVRSLADLAGKTVNLDYKDSETDLIASRIFSALGIAVKAAHDDQRFALKRLLEGEIAAVAVSTGAPQDLLARLGAESGLHLVPIDGASLGGRSLKPILDDYLPAELTSEMYPNLIAAGETVPTVASRVLLVIYNWEEDHVRYKRSSQFVSEFFSRIDEIRTAARHPKWREVNLAAEVPGWTRFKPAQDWLNQSQAQASGARQTTGPAVGGTEAQKAAFDAFLAERTAASGPAGSTTDKDALFSEFQSFWQSRYGQGSAPLTQP